MNRQNGFTLIELVIAVAIIGILASIAYPSYQEYVTRSRRVDAQAALLGFANAMERHHTRTGSYLGAGTTNNNNTGAPLASIFASQSPLDSGTKHYNLTIQSATSSSFTLRATPIAGGVQTKDGYLEIEHTGAKSWTRSGSTVNCWEKSC